jgi:adenosine kinase
MCSHARKCPNRALIVSLRSSLVANLAAANKYNPSHLLQAENWALVEQAKVIYVAGFFLTVTPPGIMHLAKHALENNKPFAMNISAPFICQFFKEALDSFIPYWDFIFGNETEMAAFAQSQGWSETDLVEIAKKTAALPKLNDKRQRTVVITQGADPTIVVVGSELFQFPVIPIAKEAIVDTNGAGDSFVGGFLAMLALEKPLAQSVACGHYCAHTVLQHSGCTYPAACGFKAE